MTRPNAATASDPPELDRSPASGWWRRNRWGLALVPVAVVAALLGASHRVPNWWQAELRDPVAASPGEWVSWVEPYEDRDGPQVREVRVRLDGLVAVDEWGPDEPIALPPGTRAVGVDLAFEADPDVPLSTCQLSLRDRTGTRYGHRLRPPDHPGFGNPVPCVPVDASGPIIPVFPEQEASLPGDPVRPDSWTTRPVVLVPESAEIVAVDLWWEPPDHLAFTSAESANPTG